MFTLWSFCVLSWRPLIWIVKAALLSKEWWKRGGSSICWRNTLFHAHFTFSLSFYFQLFNPKGQWSWVNRHINLYGRKAYWPNKRPVLECDLGLMLEDCLVPLFFPGLGCFQNSLFPMPVYSSRGKRCVINVVYKPTIHQCLLWARYVNSHGPYFLVWKIIYAHSKNIHTNLERF